MADSSDVIFHRRSIRKFTDEPVTKEDITRLLEAAMAAPTAMNAQPWEFVVITDPEILQKIRNCLIFGKYNHSTAIAVCGSKRVSKKRIANSFWVQDCSAAMENILLEATTLGLGSVWIGVYPIKIFVNQISQILNLPSEVTPLGLVYVGYPAEFKEPRTQYDEKKVHWQLYEPRANRQKQKPSSKKADQPTKLVSSISPQEDPPPEEELQG